MDDSRAVCDMYAVYSGFFSKSNLCSSCRRQIAKYTCPKCNLPYCSLACFRSQVERLSG